MAFLKHGTCPVLRDWLIMDVIMSIRESRHWNKRVVGIGSRGQDLDGVDKAIFLISSDDTSPKSSKFDISLLIKQTSYKIIM